MSTATQPEAGTTTDLTVDDIVRRYPSDPRLMSSPEGDTRGLKQLRHQVETEQRQAS